MSDLLVELANVLLRVFLSFAIDEPLIGFVLLILEPDDELLVNIINLIDDGGASFKQQSLARISSERRLHSRPGQSCARSAWSSPHFQTARTS
jgi:hypothetical protein